MDSLSAFARGQASRHQEPKVFDWNKAAQIIRDRKLFTVCAGLIEDWEYTGDYILVNGVIPKESECRAFLSSTWATPALMLEDEMFVDCFIMASQSPKWDSGTFWPESARRILDPFLLTQLY